MPIFAESQRPPVPGVELGEQLGAGAFGAVYRARHRTLEVDVAVKLLDITGGDAGQIARALQEARLMARLDHPNLLRIYDAGRVGAYIYLILEIMDESCAQRHQLPAPQMLDWARQLLSGLQSLHDARILHRDIKPANCLWRERDGRVKLADLGIALEHASLVKATQETAGTLPFMAPELLADRPRYSPQSDLYALGLTFACLMLETEPFPKGSLGEVISWVHSGERPRLSRLRPDAPPELTTLVERLLAPEPTDRPANAAEALAALSAFPALISSAPTVAAPKTNHRVGPWLLGGRVYESGNWHGYVVSHSVTGVAARLSFLRRDSSMWEGAKLILESAERACWLEHHAILDIFDWGEAGGVPYVVTGAQGRTLLDLVGAGGPLGEAEAVHLAATVADGLAYLHEQGMVYQNVDVGSTVITADARSAQLSWPIFCVPTGTPATREDGSIQRAFAVPYAAPEVLLGTCDTIETAVDLYCLGELIYFLLTARTPYQPQNIYHLGQMKRQPPPDLREFAPEVTAPTVALVNALMRFEPAQRPAGAALVRDQLGRLARRLRGLSKASATSSDATILDRPESLFNYPTTF